MGSWGRCDFAELERLAESMGKMQADFETLSAEIVKEQAKVMLKKVTKRTPVKSGNLRRSWQSGPVVRTESGAETEVFNPVSYAPYVEYGHRQMRGTQMVGWVEGRHMLTESEMEMQTDAPAIAERKLREYFKGAAQ